MTSAVELRSLTVAAADVMAAVLADPSLYEFTGGEPPSVEELRRLYEIQTRGHSADGSEEWINLVVVLEPDRTPIGYVQATVPRDGGPAEIAWVIGRPWQGRGYATRAAQLLIDHLEGRGVRAFVAHIHPDHAASQRVAYRLGMHPTGNVVDGEQQWQLLGPTSGRKQSETSSSGQVAM